MKNLFFLLFIIFLLTCCGLRVDLYEIATSSPEIQVKTGSQFVPANSGRYSFGTVDLYFRSSAIFTIQNRGDAKLRITGLSIQNEDMSCYSIDTTFFKSVLDSGKSTFFSVQFKPSVQGFTSEQVLIVSNDPERSRYLFLIEGNGSGSSYATPEISVRIGNLELPAPYDFGSISAGSSTGRTVSIRNDGTAALYISGLAITPDADTFPGEFHTIAPLIPDSLEPEEELEFELIFSPGITGDKSAVVTILSDDPEEAQFSFLVSGSGLTVPAPDMVVKQGGSVLENGLGSYDFGVLWVSDTNPTVAEFLIENKGTAPLLVNDISLSVSEGFSVSSNLPLLVDPEDHGNFTIRFDPTDPGAYEETVVIRNNDPDEDPFRFTVKGTGATVPVPDINIVEVAKNSTFDFGPVPIGSTEIQPFTIENIGTEDLLIHSITLKDPSVFQLDASEINFPEPLPGGENITFFVAFTPQDTKEKKTTVEVLNDDQDEGSYRFTVRARGERDEQPDINVTRAGRSYPDGSTFYFPDTPAGEESTPAAFTVENRGSGVLHISSIFLKGKLNDFTLLVPASTMTLESGESLSVIIIFNPTNAKKRTASLVIGSDDPDESSYKINLEGWGI